MATSLNPFNRTVVTLLPPVGTTTVTTATGVGTTSTSTTSTPLPVPADQISAVTGIDPNEVAAATMGKAIPLWVGGMPRMGCHIIYGPTVTYASGVAYATFGVSFGMPADPTGTRELRELRLDGYKVWTLADGNLIDDLNFAFYPGTETQAADPVVIAAFPSAPVAHKGQCTVFIYDLPLTNYENKVPFVSALIGDTTDGADPEDGVNLGTALELIAASPYLGITFEAVDVSERVDAVIVAEKVSFIDLLVRYSQLYLWDVVQQDILRVIERGTVTPDISLSLSDIIMGDGDSAPITIDRQQQTELPKELEYSYIDPDRDFEINTVKAIRATSPVAVTVSAGTDTIALPSVHSAQEAISAVTLRHYKNELARDKVTFTTSIVGFEIEPSDIVLLDAGFKSYALRVIETLHGANWTNHIVAEPVLRCAVPLSSAPLDGLSCVTAGWSLSRKLLSSYSGPYYSALSDSIGALLDHSGNGYDLFAVGGPSTTPTLLAAAGPNDRTAAQFDGVDDYLESLVDLSNFIDNDEGYILVSLLIDAVTLNDATIEDNHLVIGDDDKKLGIYIRDLDGVSVYAFNHNGSADSAVRTTGSALVVLSIRHEAGNIYVRINNGTEASTASGNTSALTGVLRLALAGATGAEAAITIFEAATFDCAPPEGVRDALEQDFMDWVGAEAIDEPEEDPWTPASLSTLRFWVRGDDLVGADGSDVSIWEDQSGFNSDATAVTGGGGGAPQLETAELNGMNVVRAVRSTFDSMYTPITGLTVGSSTVIHVVRAVSDTAVNGTPGPDWGGSFLAGNHYPNSDGVLYLAYGGSPRHTVGDPGDVSQWHISGITSTTGDYSVYYNGDLFFNTPANSYSDPSGGLPVMFANNLGGTAQYWDGYMAECLVFNSVLSESDREKVEGYLAHKWGLASVLPIDHPYKLAPPE